jgi:hypothetical protein
MSTQAWPFLVSRNLFLDYRTIVAPDFICLAGIPNLLARVTEGNLTEQGSAICRTIYGSKAGDFTVIFQVVRATKNEIDLPDGDDVLKDQFGREIYLIEGFVFRGLIEILISQNIFDQVHFDLTKFYRQFWNSVEPPSVVPSSSISYIFNEHESYLKAKRIEPFKMDHKKSASKIEDNNSSISIGLILLIIVFIGIWFTKFFFHYSD